jgi:RNA polymerase sigma-70 factor (ECF subfamily)
VLTWPLDAVADDRDDPASLEEWSLFHEEVGRLPEEVRVVFSLVYYEGKRCEQVATLLDLSDRTVKRRYRRVKTLLSRALRDRAAQLR